MHRRVVMKQYPSASVFSRLKLTVMKISGKHFVLYHSGIETKYPVKLKKLAIKIFPTLVDRFSFVSVGSFSNTQTAN